MPTLEQVQEQVKEKIRKFGGNAHCNQLVVMEEAREKAIKNEPDKDGRQRTRIGFETYSAKAYSAWHENIEYLMERCGYNPILVVDLLLLLVQEARQHTEDEEVDGIDIAKAGLFKVCNYEEELRAAKAERRARRVRR